MPDDIPGCRRCGKPVNRSHQAGGGYGTYCSLRCSRSDMYGPRAGRWRGGTCLTAQYRTVYCPGHPRARRSSHVYQHILVAEAMLGRPLHPGEVVHHKNGCGLDNRPANLEVWPNHGSHQSRYHVQRGEAHRWSRFTAAQIQDIRLQWRHGASKWSLARQYRTSTSYIHKIVMKRVWKHV